MREFLDPFDATLNCPSRELTIKGLMSSDIKSLIKDMRLIASGERDEDHPNRPTLVGLSSPQLGELVRVILVDIAADPSVPNFTPNLKLFINPRITDSSAKESLMREGCYSTGEICGAVMRPEVVEVVALDEKGIEFKYKSSNIFQSHIIQHEIDHLDGIRFPSRIRNQKHLHLVEPDDFQDYRENWSNWSKLYPFEKWLLMYEGGDYANI